MQHEHISLLCPNILCVDAEEMLKEITPGYYDDVITDGLKVDRETGVSLLFYNSIEYTFKLKYYSTFTQQPYHPAAKNWLPTEAKQG